MQEPTIRTIGTRTRRKGESVGRRAGFHSSLLVVKAHIIIKPIYNNIKAYIIAYSKQ
jgi:hypothetical protein